MMKHIISTSLVVFLSLSACTSLQETAAAIQCGIESVEHACILSAAELSLALITDDADWVSSAVEIALAACANDEADKALNTLRTSYERWELIEDPTTKATLLHSIAKAFIESGYKQDAREVIKGAETLLKQIDNEQKQWDIRGKFLAAQAEIGNASGAISSASNMPTTTENLAAFKARTLKEIAEAQAKNGNVAGAYQTTELITEGLTYYKATALTHIAEQAFKSDENDLGDRMLSEAETIARAQEDGYFVAGALREIGKAKLTRGQKEVALSFFEDAKKAARLGKTKQHKARALSRIGTGLADRGLFEMASGIYPESVALAEEETSKIMQPYAYYEIAGSAAFAGDFETALKILERIPETEFGDATSLKGAAQRDLAWGYAKHGRVSEAVAAANAISTPRERIQALSRIIRILNDPGMQALPRYL